MADFHRILPCTIALIEKNEKDRGWRYRVSREDGEMRGEIVEEQVWPEKVSDPKANHVRSQRGRVGVRLEEARWIRDALNELIADMERLCWCPGRSDEDWDANDHLDTCPHSKKASTHAE